MEAFDNIEPVEAPVRVLLDPRIEDFCLAYRRWIDSQYDYEMPFAERDRRWLHYCTARDIMLSKKLLGWHA